MRFTQMLCCLAAICFFITVRLQGQNVYPGDLIITEFMANPSSIPDSEGEYIEIYNRRSVDIELSGFILSDDGSDHHIIQDQGSLIIPPESFMVLAISSNPGVLADYVYQGFTLSNSGDEVILSNNLGIEIARLNYGSGDVSAGISKELNAVGMVDKNGVAAIDQYSSSANEIGNGDLGSPGLPGSTDLFERTSFRLVRSMITASEDAGETELRVMIEDPDGTPHRLEIHHWEEQSTAEGSDFGMMLPQLISFEDQAEEGDIKSLRIALFDDDEYEGDETALFKIELSNDDVTAEWVGDTTLRLIISDDEMADVVINEIHADPDAVLGDADGNGVVNSSDDEFIELVNREDVSIPLAGWTLSDAVGVKYTFENDALLPGRSAFVIFGGFDFQGSFGGSLVRGTGSLSLNNGGDEVILKDKQGNVIDSLSYGSEGGHNQSLVREPEFTGPLTGHSSAVGSGGSLYSPGLHTNGKLFSYVMIFEGKAGWRMLSTPVEDLPISRLKDELPIQGYDDGFEPNFYTGYDGTAFTKPPDLEGNIQSGAGFILYFFNNEQAGSKSLPLIMDLGGMEEPTEEVVVSLHADGDGWNLLGNPFQTTYDLNNLITNGGTLSSSVAQIWDPASGTYVLSTVSEQKIAAGQGFFLQNNDATSLSFPVSGKTNGTRFYKQETSPATYVQLGLSATDRDGKALQDHSIVIFFHEDANRFGDTWDVEKLLPLQTNYAMMLLMGDDEVTYKAQDSRSFSSRQEEVFQLGLLTRNTRSHYSLNWLKSSRIPDNWSFTFRDHLKGIEVPMDSSFNYVFTENKVLTSTKNTSDKLPGKIQKGEVIANDRFEIILIKEVPSSIHRIRSEVVTTIHSNYPNPFNPYTQIVYSLSSATFVQLTIYDAVGREIERIVNEEQLPGMHMIVWDGSEVASGIYFCRLVTELKTLTHKMTLIK